MTIRTLQELASIPLSRELAATLGTSARNLVLRRARPRAADHILLEYAAGAGTVAAQWFGDMSEPANLERLEAAARATSKRLPPTARVIPLRDRGMMLQAGGADRNLVSLASLVARPEATLLSHRAERRAIVRLSTGSEVRFAKVVRPRAVASLLRPYEIAGRIEAFGVPRLLEPPVEGRTIWSFMPGESLHDALAAGNPFPVAEAAGRALRALHDSTPDEHLPQHPASAAGDVLSTWVARLTAFGPVATPRVLALEDRAHALLSEPSTPLVPIHRDFHDQHALLTHDGRVNLLDFDTMALGEAALDLANMLVHLELRTLLGHCSPSASREAAAGLLDGYRPAGATLRRVPAYAAATRLRLYCLYSFRPGSSACERLLQRLESPLLAA
jgi:aminoglycoside phosphotransferase (APT) family kinase protein